MLRKWLFKSEVIFDKYYVKFKTVNGEIHNSKLYNWICRNKLNCSTKKHLYTSIQCDDYIKDEQGLVYPLKNIISVEFHLIETKTIKMYEACLPYLQTFFTDDELVNIERKYV